MRLTVDKMLSRASGLSLPISPQDLLNWQLKATREAMNRAASAGGFYAKHFADLDISSLRTFKSLERVPFTTQEDIIESPDSFLCIPLRDVTRITTLHTSGSSAKPKRIFFSDADLENTVDFFGAAIIPIMVGCPRVMIMMSDDRPNSMGSLFKSGVEHNDVPVIVYGNVRDIDDAAAAIEKDDCIVGMPSDMLNLARTYPHLRPGCVLLSADYVPKVAVSSIRDNWQCRVYTHYGMTETCFACAVQNLEGGVHRIRNERVLIEVVDVETGRQLDFGEEGEIVITIFGNEAMPLFRYRTGDISALEHDVTPDLPPGLAFVRGRIKNVINVNGVPLSIESLDEIMYSFENVRHYDAQLDRTDRALKLNVESAAEFDAESMAREVENKLAAGLRVAITNEPMPPAVKYKRNITLLS